MKKAFLVFIILFHLYSHALAQGKYTYTPGSFNASLKQDSSIYNKLERDPNFKLLSSFEKSVFYTINYVRKHPKEFAKEAVEPYLEAYPKLKAEYGEGLKDELNSRKPVSNLEIELRLLKIARLHAVDLGKNNLMSHISSNGETTQQRFSKEGIGCGSECINMASSWDALEVVLSLLVDYKVSNLGHRRSLLNPEMTKMGVGMANGTTPEKIQYTVIDLGCF